MILELDFLQEVQILYERSVRLNRLQLSYTNRMDTFICNYITRHGFWSNPAAVGAIMNCLPSLYYPELMSKIREVFHCEKYELMDLAYREKDIYMAALENPDSLTRVEQYGDCEFELLNYVGDYAYQELTGRSAYEDCTPEMEKRVLEEISGEIKYHPLIEYPLQPPDVAAVYPEIGDMIMKKYSIRFFSKDSSLWNTSLPELKAMIEKGAAEVRKLKKAKQKNKDKPRKRDDPSR